MGPAFRPVRGVTLLSDATVSDITTLSSFSYRWPDGAESFEGGWTCTLTLEGATHHVRHGLGGREVYGRQRVHTVTWLDGAVQVEGVEADDYPTTLGLLSLLRQSGRKLVRTWLEVPGDYEGFEIVEHRREIDAKQSRNSLAVKIAEGDLVAWGVHAALRARSRTARKGQAVPRRPLPQSILAEAPTLERRAMVAALLAHGRALATSLGGGTVRFTPNAQANALLHSDPFAFLTAVIADQGIPAERAWAVPYELSRRLGHLDPARIALDRDGVRQAFSTPPKLHRFINDVAGWTCDAASIVMERFAGDASAIWSDRPSAAKLRRRFDDFPGIGQKKAAMAVEILERDLRVPLTDLSGSDIAYDVHVRRVFLRTGLSDHDDMREMVRTARSLHPERPGELDNPTWDIGRRWCHRVGPDCPNCPLVAACPRYIERGNAVKGI